MPSFGRKSSSSMLVGGRDHHHQWGGGARGASDNLTRSKKLLHGRGEQLGKLRDLLVPIGHHSDGNNDKKKKLQHKIGGTCFCHHHHHQHHRRARVACVHGPSGCGKTALCRAFGEDAAASGGGLRVVFTIGKVDPLHRNFPFAVIIQALEGIATALLRDDGDEEDGAEHRESDHDDAFSDEYLDEYLVQSAGYKTTRERLRGWPRLVRKCLGLPACLLRQFIPCCRWVRFGTAFLGTTAEILSSQNEEISFTAQETGRQLEEEEGPPTLTPAQLDSVREVLVQSGYQILELLPQWAKLIYKADDNSVGGENAVQTSAASGGAADKDTSLASVSERVILVILELLQLLAGMFKLIILLDDWQWADAASLQLVSALTRKDLTSGGMGIILLLSYRDDEILASDRSGNLAVWRDLPPQQVTDVPLGNLTLSELTMWMLSLLHRLPVRSSSRHHNPAKDMTKQLASYVHEQTKGNAYFSHLFLNWMMQQGRLTLTNRSRCWEWDDARPLKVRLAPQECRPAGGPGSSRASSSPTTVACVVQCQLATLPRHVQSLLQIASCLGYYFNGNLLQSLLEESSSLMLMGYSVFVNGSPEMRSALDAAQHYCLVERTGATPLYHFTHDRIQQTVYESIALEQRKLLHLRIGQHIAAIAFGVVDHRNCVCDDLKHSNPYGFVDLVNAADQCNRGSSRLVHEDERLGLIRLNLRASGVAKKRACISLAADYLRKAVELMHEERDWEQNYSLSLEVLTQSAETEYARGGFALCQERVAEVLKHSRTLDDELRARFVSMQTLGTQRRFPEAIRAAKALLKSLGEHIPPANPVNFLREYRRSSLAVKSMSSDEKFINLPPVKEERMRWIAKIMQASTVYGWNGDNAFAGLMFLRMMRTTLSHGSCESTAWAYACYGLILAGMGSELEGHRFGKLALSQIKDKPSLPGATLVIHTNLMHLYQPAAQSLAPFLSAYRIGLDTGEMELGSLNICAYSHMYIFCGLPLKPFVADIKKYGDQLRLCGLDLALGTVLPMQLLALNLTGETKDPLQLTWDACKKQGICDESFAPNDTDNANIFLHYAAEFNAYILGDLELAKQSSKRANFGQLPGTYFSNFFHHFVDGALYLALYRKKKSRKYLGIANRVMNRLTAMAKKGMVNCLGMLLLLRAEKIASLGGEVAAGKKAFDRAISHLSRTGFTHLAAIANERAGEFMLRCGRDNFWHQYYIGHAAAQYDEWGATVKTDSLVHAYPFVRLGTKPPTIKIAVRGRTQFDENYDSVDATEDILSTSQFFFC